MVDHTPSRASTAIGLCLALLAAALGIAWSGTAGADVEPAGPVTFTVTGGTIGIADGAVAICLEDGRIWDEVAAACVEDPEGPSGNPPSTLTGTVDADGNVTVPAANVVFPPLTLTDPLEIDVTIGSSKDVTGVIDPAAGTASMDLTLDVGLYIVVGSTQCQLTLPMSLAGPYDAGIGVVTLTDGAFPMPGASCPSNPGLEPLINGAVGLPSPSGSNAVTLVLALDPILVDDGGADGGADGGDDGGADGGADDGGVDGGDDGGADGGSDDGTGGHEEEPAGTYLAAAVSDATYECRAADTASQALLDLMTEGGFDRLVVNPTIRREAVAPSPGPGDAFTAAFSMRLALPADLVDGVVGVGIDQVGLTDLTWTITPMDGVSGAPLVAHPPGQTIALVAGAPAVGQLGPVTGTFTRTSELGEPVAFRSDGLTLTIQVALGAAPIDVKLACDPTAGNVLSATDEAGTPPPPPPPVEPPTAPPASPPPSGGPGAVGGPGGGGKPAGSHLPAVTSQATYECSITDPAVRSMIETLTRTPVDSLAVNPVLTMAAVSPSPAQGASFTATFSARLSLPSDIVDQVVGLGIAEATISDVEWAVHPEAGVTGEPILARPPAQQVTLAAGRPAGGDFGPFSGAFTRTSAVGEPVSFRFDALSVTIGVAAFGQDLSVPLRCTPVAGNVLTTVDQAGTAVLGRSLLPATGAGDATRQLVVLALALLAAGFVLSGADAPVRLRRRG